MAHLARYAHISPGEFGRMTPARTRAIVKHTVAFLDDEWTAYFELAKMIAFATASRTVS